MLEVISSHSYKLDTPPGIHDVFHISLLKRAADDPFSNQRQGDFRPPVIMVDREERMGSGAYLKGTHQGPSTPGFGKIERVFNPYIGTHGGPSRYGGVPHL